MADKFQIKIESILGGQSPSTYFSNEDQFLYSHGINPGNSINSADLLSGGIISPVGATLKYVPNDAILWMANNPKTPTMFLYGSSGSVYSMNYNGIITGLKDLNDAPSDEPQGSSGNGMAYYDNYMYFSRSTTVARYGPLDGTPTWTTDYWVGTLGKTALTNTSTYPYASNIKIPNHYLHRHSDGKLYIADVVDNQGTLHFIQTTKTTVEGDTDNNSTYDKINVGYGLWPTCIESYGENLSIGLIESNTVLMHTRIPAKIAFWDTVATDINQIIWGEFPDDIITAIKNLNGVLYIISAYAGGGYVRISQYIGGYSIKEIDLINNMDLPLPGAVTGMVNRLIWGSGRRTSYIANGISGVYSYGLQKSSLGNGIFGIMPNTCDGTGSVTTAIVLDPEAGANTNPYNDVSKVIASWYAQTPGVSGYAYGIDKISDNMNLTDPPIFQSRMYKIGQPFKITRVALNLNENVATSTAIKVEISTDNTTTTKEIKTINYTSYPDENRIVLRPENLIGNNDFNLSLSFPETRRTSVLLPIIIEYELLPQDD